MVSTTRRWSLALQVQCEAHPSSILQRCLCAVPFLLIPWTMPYRKGYCCASNGSEIMRIDTCCGPQWVGSLGIWICIVTNNTGRAAATIRNLSCDRYDCEGVCRQVPWTATSCEIISSRLSFEQHIFITVDRSLLIKAIGLQWYRSMPIDQFNRFARASIDTYCSTKQVCKGVDRHLQNATDVMNLLFMARLEFSCKTGCVPQYFQYKEVAF